MFLKEVRNELINKENEYKERQNLNDNLVYDNSHALLLGMLRGSFRRSGERGPPSWSINSGKSV